jgi:phage shock protein C
LLSHHNRHERRATSHANGSKCINSNIIAKFTIKDTNMNTLKLNKEAKKILGVCAGLADWTGIDATIIRLLFVVATLIGFGSPILIYIVLGLIIN